MLLRLHRSRAEDWPEDRPFGLASAWSIQESRSCHKDFTVFFRYQTGHDRFLLRVPGELGPGTRGRLDGSAEAELLYQGVC